MTRYTEYSPLTTDRIFLSYVGMETDLIFNRGIDLPGFAAFPLVKTADGRDILKEYFEQQIELASQNDVGVMLESPTWMANRDRGATIGYKPEDIISANQESLSLMAKIKADKGYSPVILSAQVGPRGDAYEPAEQMSVSEAKSYHLEQINTFAATKADLISAFTLCYAEEAAGIALAAQTCKMPVAISFTVETDGCLPTGMTVDEAIEQVDQISDNYPDYYLINCAHPNHFSSLLDISKQIKRIKGVVVNASSCSHAELNEAEILDDGNPDELGQQLGDLKNRFPHFTIFGGCCGTDFRHMAKIVIEVAR